MFYPVTEDLLGIVLEILNSNPRYNLLENGNPTRRLRKRGISSLTRILKAILYIWRINMLGSSTF